MEENKYFRTHNMSGFGEKTDYDYVVRSTCLRSRVQLRGREGGPYGRAETSFEF